MGFFDVLGGIVSSVYGYLAKEQAKSMKNHVRESGNIGGLTLDQWDRRWMGIGYLKDANLTPYNHSVGLYRLRIGSRTMYIGRAIEFDNGGFRKRLSDYRRDSDSARKHSSGRMINENLDHISVDILEVGSDENAANITKVLEKYFIGKYQPKWNLQLR